MIQENIIYHDTGENPISPKFFLKTNAAILSTSGGISAIKGHKLYDIIKFLCSKMKNHVVGPNDVITKKFFNLIKSFTIG